MIHRLLQPSERRFGKEIGQSVQAIAKRFGVYKSTVDKMVTTDLRKIKSFRQPAFAG
jgi:transposase-like protein